MLAALGAIFAAAGVGTTIGAMAGAIIPSGSVFLAVLLYAFGMVVFTMIMGNAFAAFPVMVAAIGVPILIHQDGGNAAVIGAVGMLSGFCGTLMTPMAANFNIVPAALLELKSQYAVIRRRCRRRSRCSSPTSSFSTSRGSTCDEARRRDGFAHGAHRARPRDARNIRTSSTMC